MVDFAMIMAQITNEQSLMKSQLSSRRFTTQDGLPQVQTETVWQDSKGYIYIGTLSGFVRYDGMSFTPFLKGQRENIIAFQENGDKVTALGFRKKFTIDGNNTIMEKIDPEWHWLTNNFNSPDLPSGLTICEDDKETHRRVCRITDKGIETVFKSDIFDKMEPDRKLYLCGGSYYVPTPEGLYTVDYKGKVKKISDKQDVYTLTEHNKLLYVFCGDGIYTLKDDKLTRITEFEFPNPDYGLYVRKTQKGKLIIADAHSIFFYDGKNVTLATEGYNMIKSIFVDRWDRLWVATYQGVYCFFHSNFTNHRLTNANDIIRALATSEDGEIIAGTLNGSLMSINANTGETSLIDTKAGNYYIPNAAVCGSDIYMAGNGDIMRWNGTEAEWLNMPRDRYTFVSNAADKIIIGSKSSIQSYNPKTGTTDTLSTEIPHPWAAAIDNRGILWVASSRGLFFIDKEGKTQEIEYQDKPIITSMVADRGGNILFSSADSLLAIRNGKIENLSDQIPQLNDHEIRSIFITRSGYLIIAVIDGLLVARIDKNLNITDTHFFNHENGFTAIEPLMATMTETADGTVWMACVEETVSFNPAALLNDNSEPTVIKAPKPWWQRWWIWMICAAVIALTTWLLALRYEKRRNKAAIQKLERDKKQKELQLCAIRLKAIPHFHSNVLAGIEYFILNNSTKEASRYLKIYSDFTNGTLTDIDRAARTIKEETDFINKYLQLEKLRLGDRLRYDITIDNNIDKNILIPNMLLHTYCQNAIKHGITLRPNGGSLKVSISDDEKDIHVSVEDDGVGRDEAAKHHKDSTKMGLKILLEQIELYNQSNDRPIRQVITDLKDNDGHPTGTRFEMIIPKEYKYE